MARFYPSVDFAKPPVFEKAGDRAEWTVLSALSALDNFWHVFHRTEWRDVGRYSERQGERRGEVDLIIFHPDLGLLIVEVKGGGIRLEGGDWYYLDSVTGAIKLRMKISPVDQASRSFRYFEARLKGTPLGQGILRNTAFTYTAWFPDIVWNGPLPPEIPDTSFLLDASHLGDPEKTLRRILTRSRPGADAWNPREIDTLVKTIAPEINLLVPLGSVLDGLRDRLFRMTETQIATLRVLRSQKRLLVEGCAGSGKTLLAVCLARDHLLQGKRVLLTCYNKHLAAFLTGEFAGVDGIDVLNFHELVRLSCEKHGIPYDVPKDKERLPAFFRDVCPELLEQTLAEDAMRYDTIIVDEAFDFLETWWIALEGLGVPDCSLYAFYDTSQSVFNTLDGWQPPFPGEPIRLETNLRNTRPVGEYAARLGELAQLPGFMVNEGPNPEVMPYGDSTEQAAMVLRLVTELAGKGKVPPEEIVVLSPYKPDGEHVGLGPMIGKNSSRFTTAMSAKEGKVRVGTIQSFKGLEADVVILCGIDGKMPACKAANLYVGASRARSLLYVLHNRGVS